jgi:hypothetical protein
LGFAGTVEVHLNNGGNTPSGVLKGYRSAMYLGIGLGGLGMALSAVYVAKVYQAEKRLKHAVEEEAGE